MAKEIVLRYKLKGANKTKKGLKGIDSGIRSLGKSAMKLGGTFFAAQGIISGLSKVITLSSEMEGMRRGFDNLTKSAGFSAQTFNKLKKATDGTMSSMDLMKQANNAMLLGIFESDDQMAKMFDTAQRLAQALGKDAAFGIESLVTGMGRQSKLMLDNLGIMVKAEDAYKNFANQLGTTVEGLTDQQRKQAFVNEAMKEANSLVKSLGDEQLTTADTINQMKTAIGDAAEVIGSKLSPLVTSLAKGIKSLATEIGGETTEARVLFNTLKDLNASDKVRKDAIDSINTLYGKYLPNLLDENYRLEDIEKAQNKVTNALLKRIAISANEEKIRDLMREQLELRNQEPELIDKVAQAIENKDNKAYGGMVNLQSGLSGIVMAEGELSRNRENQVKAQEEINQLNDDALSLAESFNETVVGRPEMPPLPMPGEEELEILGDIALTEEEIAFQRKENAKAQEVVQNKLKAMKLEEIAMASKGAATMQSGIESVIRGYIMEAVAGHMAKVLGGVPFPLNLILAAAAGGVVNEMMSAAFSQVRAPVSFATGGDFVTSGPQMMMVGDNPGGRERVQVTPIGSPNIEGPQGGGGIHLHFGAVTNEDYVKDFIVPEIQKAQRLNLA